MYVYSQLDKDTVRQRAAQYKDQLERHLRGELGAEEFKPLRLQNGWYVQRYAPMLRVAVPYGMLNSKQLRALAQIARVYDQPDAALFEQAQTKQQAIDASRAAPKLVSGMAHFTTRQNVQFNWIPLDKSADVMALLAEVDMHGIQTSGNCIRNITSDVLAGIAVDEVADPRPWAEIMRQWSTFHPEFAFLPRKFKIAVVGAKEDRAATGWHDVGLHLQKDASGELGFRVMVGGGMGRTPIVGRVIREFLPAVEILNYLEAVVRVYNRWGRRDNLYKARIKILVKAQAELYTREVEAEYQRIVSQDGAPHTITAAEIERMSRSFLPPEISQALQGEQKIANILKLADDQPAEFSRWLKRNVHPHQNPQFSAVTLSFKRPGQAPGDANADQLEAAAQLVDEFSCGEARVSHDQNLLLPWVRLEQLPKLWRAAQQLGLARPNIGLLSDMIACPGGDYCALANARSLPIAAELLERYQDLDELDDLGPIDLHISGCINSCGHHHSGHIGVLGVDKDGQEWYQITLGGSDGSELSGQAQPGKVIGPSFAAAEVVAVVEAILSTYVQLRQDRETFIQAVGRLGLEPFKTAANAVRHLTRSNNTVVQ
jgi:sulfite reductase (NADPH) hemoprotein beta-component